MHDSRRKVDLTRDDRVSLSEAVQIAEQERVELTVLREIVSDRGLVEIAGNAKRVERAAALMKRLKPPPLIEELKDIPEVPDTVEDDKVYNPLTGKFETRKRVVSEHHDT
jgi:hypothetical protein